MLMVLFSDLTIGQIFAVFGYLWFMLTPVQELLSIQFSWYSAKAALSRINTLLELEEDQHSHSTGINPLLKTHSLHVEVRDVDFAYNDENRVFEKLSLTIPTGKRVALVGTSGGGKSTLVQLLLGIYHPERGQILFNGHPAQTIGFEAIREQVAVVLQQPILFNDTLRHNLSLGSHYTDDTLWHALEVAQLSDVTNQLTEGLDTPIGRNGIRLSGGQRQRLAIARWCCAILSSLSSMKRPQH
ncbi:ABC-type multidrug transport system ATPase and permease component [Vibrio astriarenae]|nr:ABC-type multidrug transport system ATPase and permease component [Vibrio sp. C7]